MEQKKRVLVTGGAGFIGSHVVERLLELGHEVVVVLDRDAPGKVRHLGDRVETVRGDIRVFDDCRRAVRGVDAVIHMAALINVDHSIREPLEFYETNVRGTMNLLEAVRHEPSVEKMVYMSCHDEKTRAFTRNGLKKFNEILLSDEVLSINPTTHEVEWKPISKI